MTDDGSPFDEDGEWVTNVPDDDAITEEIEEWQATYDVETWEELEQSLADGDLASAELHKRRDVITRWEENLEDRRLIKHALALYSDVEAAREQMMDVADRHIR